MKIVFRVDASSEIGMGHLTRCLTLSNHLAKKNNVKFICQNLIGFNRSAIKHKVSLIKPLFKSSFSQKYDALETIKLLDNYTDIVIVDHYELDFKWHRIIKRKIKKLIVIDDLFDKKFDCHLIINHNLYANIHSYKRKTNQYCKILAGPEYALIRNDIFQYQEYAKIKRKSTHNIKKLLISMGGADKNNITQKILERIEETISIAVVVGPYFSNDIDVKKYKKKFNDIDFYFDPPNLPELYLDADLAIGAAGISVLERCILGLPSIVIKTSSNQSYLFSYLENHKIAQPLNDFSRINSSLKSLKTNMKYWREISSNGMRLANDNGARKVISHIKSLIY